MPPLYRVLPWIPDAAPGEPGHPLFVAGLNAGRIDNAEYYETLYASDARPGACAEAFGYLRVWSASMMRGSPSLPGSIQALAIYELDETPICDLDEAVRLVDLGLRPSQVVTRDRPVTRAWALRIFEEERWAGIRWWSYYDPRWGSHGVWAFDAVEVADVVPLSIGDAAVLEAADILRRVVR